MVAETSTQTAVETTRGWTYSELLARGDERRVELYDGN